MTARRHPILLLLLALFVVTAVACEDKKPEEKPAEKPPAEKPAADATAEAPKADAAAQPEEQPKPEEQPTAAAEYIKLNIAHHKEGQPPVDASFEKFELKSATVDLANPANAMAEYEVDLSSFKTDKDKRDEHVKSPDFLDVAQFAKATFKVHKLEAADAPDTFNATASLDLHGVKKDIPVTFKVVEKAEDGGITIEGQGKLMRMEYGVGAKPEDVNAANEVAIDVRLKLPAKK